MLWIAPLTSAVSSLVGLYVSYYQDTSSGGMVVLCQGILFALVYLAGPRDGVLLKVLRRRRVASLGERA